MSAISDYVVNNANSFKINLLPLMHSCDAFDGQSIIEKGSLQVNHCKVFDEELLYFFYGKPSYPVSEKIQGSRSDEMYCPVCFIVDPKYVDIYKAFPFDSGAFENGIYSGYLHRHMKIEDFEIGLSYDAIEAYIRVFFGDNSSYLKGCCQKLKCDDNLAVLALSHLFGADGEQRFDERAHTVEVVTDNSVWQIPLHRIRKVK